MAVVLDIFDMQFSIQIMMVKCGMILTIELYWNDSVLLAHCQVKGGSSLNPFSLDV